MGKNLVVVIVVCALMEKLSKTKSEISCYSICITSPQVLGLYVMGSKLLLMCQSLSLAHLSYLLFVIIYFYYFYIHIFAIILLAFIAPDCS